MVAGEGATLEGKEVGKTPTVGAKVGSNVGMLGNFEVGLDDGASVGIGLSRISQI